MVVIPTYNERDTIVDLIGKILELPRFRVLVVDDNSPDGTGTLVTDLSLKEPRVGLLPRSGKLGLGSAYIAGFRRALREGSQYIFEMDADFSHDPAYLPYLLQAVELHCDLAIGSRYVRGGDTVNWGFMRQFISRSGNLYAGLILQLPTTDSTSGFRCYHRRVLAALNLSAIRSNGYAFQIEMVYRTKQAGFRIQELPIIFPDRRVGKSKMSRHIVLEALINVWRLRLGLM
ncbi:MAG: polyprenol monophosphomannose synthase [Chloroflexaceae bacterium]|nr:polyprenol monophosphomannose synthase [Chloroflexaceae bacterium]NJL33839.1 polyprenol monophosphomannose synthase [Chloroflexaceae bacterium]NJO07243.1 polyprenol monophosphomannose synthase [Chloroflexaceae bacterium]